MNDYDLRELLAEDTKAVLPPLRQWLTVAVVAGGLAMCALVGAGAVLSYGGLGRAAANRGCEANLLAGLLLVLLAGMLAGMARIVVDRRFEHELVFDTVRLAATLPVPLAALTFAAPGFMGCSFAVAMADWGALGRALLGTPGMTIAGAGAFAAGLALTNVVRVRVPLANVIEEYERLRGVGASNATIVDRALAAHDLLDEGSTLAGPLGGAMRIVDANTLLEQPAPPDDL